jgi:hypothetical protein
LGALCIGGALAGGLLAALWVVDGTMAADPPAGYFSSPVNLLGAMVGSLPVGVLGAGVGGFFGLLEGAVLAFPWQRSSDGSGTEGARTRLLVRCAPRARPEQNAGGPRGIAPDPKRRDSSGGPSKPAEHDSARAPIQTAAVSASHVPLWKT